MPEYVYNYIEDPSGTYGKVGIQYFPLLRQVIDYETTYT